MENQESKQMNPWGGIWRRPRETMRFILESNPYRKILLLSILNGLVSGLVWVATLWSKYPSRLVFRTWPFTIFMLIFGAIAGIIGLYLGGWLYKIVGRLLKGKGNYTEVKSAVGWSNYPFLIVSILNFFNIFTLRQAPVLSLIIGIIAFIFTIWAFIISLKLIGEAHQFSAWKALGTVILTVIVVFILFLVIGLLIVALKPLFAVAYFG